MFLGDATEKGSKLQDLAMKIRTRKGLKRGYNGKDEETTFSSLSPITLRRIMLTLPQPRSRRTTTSTTSSKRNCSSSEYFRRWRSRQRAGEHSPVVSVFIGPILEDRTMHQPLRFTQRCPLPVTLTSALCRGCRFQVDREPASRR